MPRGHTRLGKRCRVAGVMGHRAGGVSGNTGCLASVLCHESTEVPCCTKDEGGPFGAVLQGEASNCHKLLWTQVRGGERYGKGVAVTTSSMDWRDERKRTPDDASLKVRRHQNQGRTSGLPSFLYCTERVDEDRLLYQHFGEPLDEGA